MVVPLRERPAYRSLERHFERIRDVHLRTMFTDDPNRAARLTVEGAGLRLDCSKHRIVPETLDLLIELAGESGLRERIDAMFAGERVNATEDRPALTSRSELRATP